MCGIFGIIGKSKNFSSEVNKLINYASRRGKDSSGILTYKNFYKIYKADFDIKKLKSKLDLKNLNLIIGIGRLITNGNIDNQPLTNSSSAIFHNGIIINEKKLFELEKIKRFTDIDSEIILSIANKYIQDFETKNIANIILKKCIGTNSAAIVFPKLGKLILLSNNGSLYYSILNKVTYFSSELNHLKQLKCKNIKKLINQYKIINIPKENKKEFEIEQFKVKRRPLVPSLNFSTQQKKLLETTIPKLVRCKKCLLPHTMPYITFNDKGICNYCTTYQKKNQPKPFEKLIEIVSSYKKGNRDNCIVPFSGGRDSSYALHLIVKELRLKPITYTYDWGMTADIGRRNISIMCSKLNIENIIVAADIKKKRDNIKKNVEAWLKKPHLGMISLFTAGDKHFFQYVDNIRKETNIDLNIWGNSPFEITHFKSGFLGIRPDLNENSVYAKGINKQIKYQTLRIKEMFKNPSYFNSSLWDTVTGEYFRSIKKRKHSHYIFDYWKWNEKEIDNTLLNQYEWEFAKDSKNSWRIGDGTAAFYNYIYYTIAGFTEHDTFRSNQIREGEISRKKALELVERDNRPRYESLVMYFDMIGVDFSKAIKKINSLPRLWYQNPNNISF